MKRDLRGRFFSGVVNSPHIMSSPLGSLPWETALAIKRLKRLVMLLVFLCLLLGGYCGYLLHAMDRDYNAIVQRSLTAMNLLHKLTKESLGTQRAVLAGLVAGKLDDREAIVKQIGQSLGAGRDTRQEIHLTGVLDGPPDTFAAIESNGRDYEAAVAEYLKLLAVDKIDEANLVRHDQARVALNLYLESIEKAARQLEAAGLQASEDYSADVHRHTAMVLGLAGLPALFIAAIAATVLAVIAMMWVVLRRTGIEEGP